MTLELRNVSKRFPGVLAVDDVNFEARGGEITGYLGPNGSGKSTTMKMITGLIGTTSGEILFDGRPIQDDLIALKQRMGYVPEEPHLYPHLSGLELLTMVGQLRDLPAQRTAERIDGLLRLFSLHGDRHAPISSYSKGMRQKVLLSRGASSRSRPDPAGRAVLRTRRADGAGAAQPDPGAGVARQGGAVQLARAGHGGEGVVARGDSASGTSGCGRFDRSACVRSCRCRRWRRSFRSSWWSRTPIDVAGDRGFDSEVR